ncbi:LCP family protein [Candidatus Dojkabacteria bacterium]|nr:LCP family protein [Candidatus Dojkabacteria bacterium]
MVYELNIKAPGSRGSSKRRFSSRRQSPNRVDKKNNRESQRVDNNLFPRSATKNVTSSNKKKLSIIQFLLIVGVIVVLGAGIWKYIVPEKIKENNPFSPEAIFDPKLKQENGMTNILLLGVDTRESDLGLQNTDTIIVATIDYENDSVVMTSLPRDLWVDYTLPDGSYASSRINSVYAYGEGVQEGKGIETLSNLVEDILDVEIQYYAKIRFEGFIKAIDELGGIDIHLEEEYTDAYPKIELSSGLQSSCDPYYYAGSTYCIFTFPAGDQHLDGEHALIYARSRILSPYGDYDRARRQQFVIDAVKDKVLSDDTLKDPGTLLSLYGIFKDYVELSEGPSVSNISAVLNVPNKVDLDNKANVVLDPMFGGEYCRFVTADEYSYLDYINDGTYSEIHNYFGYIRKYPKIYNEAPTVSVYYVNYEASLVKDWVLDLETSNPLINAYDGTWYVDGYVTALSEDDSTSVRVLKFTDADKPNAEKYLKSYFGVDKIETDFTDQVTNAFGEDYVVIIYK